MLALTFFISSTILYSMLSETTKVFDVDGGLEEEEGVVLLMFLPLLA